MAARLKLKRSGAPEHEVEIVAITDSMVTARIDGEEVSASLTSLTDGSAMLAIGDRRVHIAGAKRGNSILVAAGAMSAEYQMVEARRGSRHGGLAPPTLHAPLPGKGAKISRA